MSATIDTRRIPARSATTRRPTAGVAPIDPLIRRQVAGARGTAASIGETRRPSEQVFRRRRRVVGAVAVFALAIVFVATQAVATDPGSPAATPTRTIVAQPGDSIWGIARRIAPTGDITELVEALILANGSQLRAGQVVRIP